MNARSPSHSASPDVQSGLQFVQRTAFGMVLLSLLLGVGCGTPHVEFSKRAIQPINTYQHRETVDGFTIAIDPITNATEVASLFGVNLHKADLLPVLVVATNENTALSYLISSDLFQLTNGKWHGTSGESSKPRSTGTEEALGWTVAVMGIGPTLIAAPFLGHEVEKKYQINQHFRSVELLRKALSPGASTSGYIYFKVPNAADRKPEWTLVFTVRALQTDTQKDMVFRYNW